MVIHVVTRPKGIIVSAIASKLFVLVDQEMSNVQMLVRCEAVAALKEECRGVVGPGTPRVDIAGTGAEGGEAEVIEIALFNGDVMP